jgi:hypothetical protein
MRAICVLLMLASSGVCIAAQPPAIARMAKRIVPKVRRMRPNDDEVNKQLDKM